MFGWNEITWIPTSKQSRKSPIWYVTAVFSNTFYCPIQDYEMLLDRSSAAQNLEVMSQAIREGRQARLMRKALFQLPIQIVDGAHAGLTALPLRASQKAAQEMFQREYGRNLYAELQKAVNQKIEDFQRFVLLHKSLGTNSVSRLQQMDLLEKSNKDVDRKLLRLEGRLNRSDRLRHLRRLPSRSGNSTINVMTIYHVNSGPNRASRQRPQLAGRRNTHNNKNRGKVVKIADKKPSAPGPSRNNLAASPITPRQQRKNPRPIRRGGRGAVINAIASSLIGQENQPDLESPQIIQEMSGSREEASVQCNPQPLNLTVQMTEVSGHAQMTLIILLKLIMTSEFSAGGFKWSK